MKISWFVNEEGSTSLTMVLGIVLSAVLLASSAQWYWTNSSSSDIQAVADISALAAADVTAKSVMLIQALDAMLLSANLFGLVLHAVTVVAGLLVVLTAPAGGAGAMQFFERALDFNKRFCDKRKKFATEAHRFAEAVSEATPYLAMTHAYQVAHENSQHLKDFNGTSYVAVAIPFPARGKVELTGFADSEDRLLKEVSEVGEENRDSAHEIKRLEDEVEAAIDQCFALDVFLPAGTQRPYWDPLNAADDFGRGWSQLRDKQAPAQNGLAPITDNDGNRAELQQRYREDYKRIADSLDPDIRTVFTRVKSSGGADVSDLSVNTLLSPEHQRRIYVVKHEPGERKAYHQQSNCFGLSNAGQLETHNLNYVLGDTDHPPCLICKPLHWQAVQAWEKQLEEFVQAWNKEAAALRRWYTAQQALEIERGAVQERTTSVLEDLIGEAQSFLMGGRLSYTPAGARGYLCVVVSTQERELPDFTLPALTDSGDVVLGRQIAFAGARLMPSDSESTIPSLLSESRELAETDAVGGFAGLTKELVGDSGKGVGGISAVTGFALGIWGSCLELYTKGSAGLEKLVSGLPLGLDTIAVKAMRTFFEEAQISAPDLRKPIPTLVNTADIGDVSVGGFEAQMVKAIATAKEGLEKSGGASLVGLRENLSEMIDELNEDVNSRIDELMKIQVLGVSIPLPFSDVLKDMAAQVFTVIRSKEEEIFAWLH